MLKEFLKNPRALIYAVLVHVALALLLVVSITWNSKPPPKPGAEEIVQAVVIDESQLQAEQERQRAEEEAKRKAEAQRRQAEAEQRRAEEQRQRAAEEAAQRKKQQEAEKQRQAQRQAEQETQERQRAAEQKRLAEQAAKRKMANERRQAEEARRKAEAQRQADEARRQRENEELLRQQLAQEEQQRAEQQRQRELASLQSQYIAVLRQRVTRNWIRPPSARAGMSCTVRVRQIPGGEVVEARVVQGSGDPAFDRSAETAVLKSSPLPAPPDPALFLREFDFVFKPEG